MKKLYIILLVFIMVFAFSAWAYSKNTSAQEELIRFHVIANSDADYDQEVKLKVRDAILKEFTNDLSACSNYNEAYTLLSTNLSEIESIAKDTLKTNSFSYGAKAVIKKDNFPTKKYGDLTLAAGEYQSIKIILGAGEGKNWWCVMFPPLCFVDISQNVGVAKLESYSPEDKGEIVAAGGEITQVKVKSKLFELIK